MFFDFDYFNFLSFAKKQNVFFDVNKLNEFNIFDMKCLLFKIVKNQIDDYEYSLRDKYYFLTKSKEKDQKYVDIVLNQSIDNIHVFLDINYIKFDKDSNNTFERFLKKDANRYYHNLNGPARIRLVFNGKREINYDSNFIWYNFAIENEKYYFFNNYLEKLKSILKEKEFMKFVVIFLNFQKYLLVLPKINDLC